MEKNVTPPSGFLGLFFILITIISSIYFFMHVPENEWMLIGAILSVITTFLLIKGLMVINPNHSRVLNFFGKYVGTVKANGFFIVNPFYNTHNISLRAQNLEGSKLKVNDKMGNPIEIAAVVVWYVGDTYKAAYDVADYKEYVHIQSEAAIRHLTNSWDFCPDSTGCRVDFHVDFEFRSRILQAAIGVVFHEAVRRMVGAFHKRADDIYGAPAPLPGLPDARPAAVTS